MKFKAKVLKEIKLTRLDYIELEASSEAEARTLILESINGYHGRYEEPVYRTLRKVGKDEEVFDQQIVSLVSE